MDELTRDKPPIVSDRRWAGERFVRSAPEAAPVDPNTADVAPDVAGSIPESWARRKVEDGDETPVWRVELAAIHALKKDYASALDALDRAYDAGYREYGLLERDPIFAPFRRDNRFVTLLDRMRQDVSVQRQIAQERGLLDVDALLAPQK